MMSYKFTDNNGSFVWDGADKIRTLYLPLCNERIMSSITPDLRGDIKSGQDSFLLPPVSRIDLINSRFSRNFWVYFDKGKVWSATGVSKDIKTIKEDKFKLEAGLLWQKVARENKRLRIRSQILSFVPSAGEPLEIMQVTLTNTSSKKISIIPTAAIPIYARGANNTRDHRHVTSLLQRIKLEKFGVVLKPTLSFDEAGHIPNKNYYFVLGWDEDGRAPQYIYPTQDGFCGDSGDLESPESILENKLPQNTNIQGKESMGALRFREKTLMPNEKVSYIVVMGITKNYTDITRAISNFKSLKKVKASLEKTKLYWQKKAGTVKFFNKDKEFDNWLKWVNIQPFLRKIYGCSFLPDFDYGKGGRGWRDLWQDCLGLILSGSKEVRSILINNFSGIRPDGSNATIIGKNPGEFIADRNDIARVWMDHGVWPLLTTEFYIEEFNDLKVLFEKSGYFSDQHIFRSRKINRAWKECKYKGTILEHLILQNLTQFYNVGEHNYIRLEGADWNDGLDMAYEYGESIAFSCMYASNLKRLAELLRRLGGKRVNLFSEMKELFKRCGYGDIKAKQKILNDYFTRVSNGLSGKTVSIDCATLIKSLEEKADWMIKDIRRRAWIEEGFFNGYYDNKKARVEGKVKGKIRMMLQTQAFAILSGVATDEQIKRIIKNIEKYLFDKELGGYRLNTDFGREEHNLGRAFSFSYGDKENGAVFSHMVIIYAYALFSRGFKKEALKALCSLYNLSVDTKKSKIYPCLPEYFNSEGRGMYSYLTGSASWFLLTVHKYLL
ncbi:MAG: cellobiose phosphorylase [Candidatus Omnitrophota bacterium]